MGATTRAVLSGLGVGAFLAALASAATHAARAEDPPPLPASPTTPLPEYENPLHDAQVGETMRYVVNDLASPKPRWTRYFEERILARSEGADLKVLLETVETNEEGTKVFSVDGARSGWMPAPAAIPLPPGARWLTEKERDETLYVGTPPTRAIRCRHRYREEPETPGDVDGPKRTRQIWFSHDVPGTGRAKEHPAQGDGEKMVLSWDRRLPPEECAERAKRYGPADPPKPADPAMSDPGMSEPGMSEPGMDDGMSEPGMGG